MTTPSKTHRLPDSPHGLPAADVLAALEVSVSTGLSEEEASLRLKLYGLNTISCAPESQCTCRPCPSVSKPRGCFARRSGRDRILFQGMGGRRRNRRCARAQYPDWLRNRDQGRALHRGAQSARDPFGQGVPRRAYTPHSGRAPGAGRHLPSRCRRCDHGGPPACGGVEPRSG